MSEIKFDLKGIGEVIKTNTLKVPIYQRSFAWSKKEVSELFDDIKVSINEDEYFLGTIVLTKNKGESRLEIIDGQQRISTIVILFAALKGYIDDPKGKESIQSDYLSRYDLEAQENIPKLELNMQDNEFYREFIVNEDENYPVKRDSHKRIKSTFEESKNIISGLLELNNQDPHILYDWKKFIDEKLKIVLIIVPSNANAFTIFETLNDRGIELAQLDLLKNYLYSKAGTRIKEAQNFWIELTSKIESAEDESLILTYIKHYWSSQHGFTREKNKELYISIKNEIRNSTKSINLIYNLKNDADLYIAILNHNNLYWKDFDNKCKEYIKTLNYFGLEQYRPLLLSILKKFEKDEVKKSLKLIVSWLVRNLIVGAMGGGTLEKTYAGKAKDIFNKKIKKATELRESLKVLIPQNKDFKEQFLLATVSKHKLARYYLSAIENFHRGKENPELLVNMDTDSVNLEHILPQKPEDNWPNFTEEDIITYGIRIGNLTLMKTKENNEFKSSKFSDKKKKYKESDLWITNSLGEHDDWTKEKIAQRQEELSELAVETWSLKFD
ncbi:MAG: DUF262 domain-containing protein [Candidatus Marinimicrobia bacterium]|nr:DUF262 domain-containing protein [Candidatus Neomarinimicrobiota bacterium]